MNKKCIQCLHASLLIRVYCWHTYMKMADSIHWILGGHNVFGGHFGNVNVTNYLQSITGNIKYIGMQFHTVMWTIRCFILMNTLIWAIVWWPSWIWLPYWIILVGPISIIACTGVTNTCAKMYAFSPKEHNLVTKSLH